MPRKKTKDEFIAAAQQIHGYKYDYSQVTYVNNKTKVLIICPIHGKFYMTPNNHTRGQGCSKCGDEQMALKQRKSVSSFIEAARKVHGNKYEYTQVEYINQRTKVAITCLKHGVFYQSPSDHISGSGCPQCSRESLSNKYRTSVETFKSLANLKHNFKYDYSLVEYSSLKERIKIICPIHGIYMQNARSHMNGRIRHRENALIRSSTNAI